MYLIRLTLYGLACLGLLVFASCESTEPTPLSEAQTIARVWRVQAATANGSAATFAFNTFRLTFAVDSQGNPTTFTITPGNLPDGANPNYFGLTNQGTWELSTNAQTITFVVGTDRSAVSYTELSQTRLVIRWTAPAELDKAETDYVFTLIPQA